MCGIAGILSLNERPVLREELRSMCAAIAHRGPDDEGFYAADGVGLGIRRLSVIDLATGRQPVCNEDATVWVVFNGEIYNFQELRRDLKARGHRFSTASDTEVIVHLYEEHGARCVEHLRGMFAFAVWDQRRRRLLLARDRLGIKPLYYAEVSNRFLFASEVKAILQCSEVERRLDWMAVSHLFSYLTTPASQSIIAGVRKLEPGCTLTISPGRKAAVQRYWRLSFNPDYSRKTDQLVERLRELLDDSVRVHLVSDVPLGAFLSGGIDSSAVVAAAARFASGPLKTFCIGFADEDYSEVKYARAVAAKFGTDHRELILDPNALDILEDLVWHLDEPFGDSSAIPSYLVSRLAAGEVTVALSGDGGDELFAGYDKYVVESKERRYTPPKAVRNILAALAGIVPEGKTAHNLLRHFSLSGWERCLDASTLFKRPQKSRLFQPAVLELLADYDPERTAARELWRADGHWLSILQRRDLEAYLPLDILTKVDRMSMAHSLETRVPLLDPKLVEFAQSIPPELSLKGATTKYLFKRAMKGILPDEIIARPKHGFAVPLGRWFRGQLGDLVRDVLLSPASRNRGIINTGYVENLLEWHKSGRQLDLHLWTLISFELWCRTFLDAGPARPVPQPARGRYAV
jgi:asparagine synthase (glutamine-hydrolysing)